MTDAPIFGSASFSTDGLHRTRLDRWWADGPRALYCMANPSDAGAERNDPTVLRLISITRRCGYPGFTVVNESDRIASDPKNHDKWRRAIKWNDAEAYQAMVDANLALIREVTKTAAIRIVAWGALVEPGMTQNRILAALSNDGEHDLYALGLTKDGLPKHPMARGTHRLPPNVVPVLWRGRK